ncbi:MAG: aspartate ammonia-lyase, partial [Methanobacteriota archaeon]
VGNDVAVTVANSHSNLDLSTMMPVMHHNLQQSIEVLANVSRVFAHRCIDGLSANVALLRRNAEMSAAIVTRLNPIIGYEKAAELAKESGRTGVPIKQLVVERKILTAEEADRLLDARTLTEPSEDLLGSGG